MFYVPSSPPLLLSLPPPRLRFGGEVGGWGYVIVLRPQFTPPCLSPRLRSGGETGGGGFGGEVGGGGM